MVCWWEGGGCRWHSFSVNASFECHMAMKLLSTPWVKKRGPLYFAYNFDRHWRIYGLSKFFFTVEFIKIIATKQLLHCPPHLKRVAAPPCEMTVVTNKDIFILKQYRYIHLRIWVVTNKCHFMTKFKCKLQRLFNIPPPLFYMDTDKKWKLLVNRVIDDPLLHTVPHV